MTYPEFEQALRDRIAAAVSDRVERTWMDLADTGATEEELDAMKANWADDFEESVRAIAGALWRSRQAPFAPSVSLQ